MFRPKHVDQPIDTVWTPWKSCTVRTPWSTWTNWHYTWLWGIAAGGPYLLAWLFTRCEIAPMFHYRFVIVSALPLYLFAASWWLSISMRAMRYVIVASVFVWMNVTSGPLAPQQQSRWQNERREDWQSACAFVHENSRSDSQSLWCYAGLIEGLGMQLPLNASTDEYLSYPLRAGLRLIDSDVPVAVHGLVADRKLWLEQIHQQNSISSNIAAAQRTNPRDIWIVYRGSAERLASDLKTAGLDQFPQVIPIRQFGRVSVARLSLE